MGQAASWMRAIVGGAGVLWLPAEAISSGVFPLLPSSETFGSHVACVDALKAAYAADLGQVAAKAVSPAGDTREVSLDSKGVERLGDGKARYEATLWYHNGGFRLDLKQTETSHSYTHSIRICEGVTMTVSGDQGYTLSTFEPAAVPDNPN